MEQNEMVAPANEFELDGDKFLLKKFNRKTKAYWREKLGEEKLKKFMTFDVKDMDNEEANYIYTQIGYSLLPDKGIEKYPTLEEFDNALNGMDSTNLGIATMGAIGWATKPAYSLAESIRVKAEFDALTKEEKKKE